MRLSPATRLTDRQTIWVAYRNDGSNFNRLTPPWGTTADVWAGQYAEAHAGNHRCPVSGWQSQQG
jgi:hypothetical protein